MIEVEELYKCFGDKAAVDRVSFTATDGCITGLLGHNGAGKTTTLRMLYGLLKPDAGRVLIDGVELQPGNDQSRKSLGVLPDFQGLYPRLTAREHMQYFGRLNGLQGKVLEDNIDQLIQDLDMAEIAGRKTEGFSQGESLKVSLARALVHQPRNLLLDEPTNGLDVASTRTMRRLIRQWKQEGRCVVFSSHIMQEVGALCDTLVIMADGAVVASGTPDQVCEQAGCANLEDAFVRLSGIDGNEDSWGEDGAGDETGGLDESDALAKQAKQDKEGEVG
jgi:sodium transport system ATP-binding protein